MYHLMGSSACYVDINTFISARKHLICLILVTCLLLMDCSLSNVTYWSFKNAIDLLTSVRGNGPSIVPQQIESMLR